MISFLILPMQRVTRLPLLLDVSKSPCGIAGASEEVTGLCPSLVPRAQGCLCRDLRLSGSWGWAAQACIQDVHPE